MFVVAFPIGHCKQYLFFTFQLSTLQVPQFPAHLPIKIIIILAEGIACGVLELE